MWWSGRKKSSAPTEVGWGGEEECRKGFSEQVNLGLSHEGWMGVLQAAWSGSDGLLGVVYKVQKGWDEVGRSQILKDLVYPKCWS